MRFSDGVKSHEWVEAWLNEQIDRRYPEWGFGMWAVSLHNGNDVIGYCGLSRLPGRCAAGEAEIGYRLIERYWARGFATEAVKAVRDYAIANLRLSRVIAITDPMNSASVGVLKKAAFHYERDVTFEGYTHPDQLFAFP